MERGIEGDRNEDVKAFFRCVCVCVCECMLRSSDDSVKDKLEFCDCIVKETCGKKIWSSFGKSNKQFTHKDEYGTTQTCGFKMWSSF